MIRKRTDTKDVLEDDSIEEIPEEELEGYVEEEDEEPVKPKAKKPSKNEPTQVPQRFGIVQQAPRIVLADLESGDVVGEGDLLIPQALANIIERLERIENSVGNLAES